MLTRSWWSNVLRWWNAHRLGYASEKCSHGIPLSRFCGQCYQHPFNRAMRGEE